MDNLKKELAELKKAHEDIQRTLDTVYKEFGALQFEYALHTAEPVQHIAAQDFAMWKSLREARQHDAESVLNIKTTQSRQSELKVFYGEIDKLAREQQHAYEKTHNAFILQFFQTYKTETLPCIAQMSAAVEPLETTINELETKRLEIEQQKHDSHFFKKLTLEPQLMTIKGRLHGLQKQRDEQLLAAGASALTDSVIAEIRGEHFPDPLEAVYSDLRAIAIKQDEITERKEALAAEQKKLEETLTECGADGIPQKRITVLTTQIKKTDDALEQAEKRQGTLYGDVFYTPVGARTDAPLSGIPDSLQPYITPIEAYRIKIEKNRLNRIYVENQIAIAAEDRKVEVFQKSIADYKEGIAQYERLITATEQDIAQSEARAAALEKANSELLPQFSAD